MYIIFFMQYSVGDRMKKLIISIVLLIIFGVGVFILGWLEFFVPLDSFGVMVSKTGGVRAEIIQPGNVTWSWERIIPTNSKIHIFSSKSQTFTKTISGSLPSAEIYKNMLEGNPNFAYSFSVDIVANINPSSLPTFVKSTGAESQEDLDEYLSKQADSIARSTIEYVLEESMNDVDFVIAASLSDSELVEGIQASTRYSDLIITSIQLNDVTLPDITMYNHAKNSYAAYQDAVEVSLEGTFELQGFDAAQDYLELERLSRLGRVLSEYPQLIDFMAVSKGETNFEIPEIPQVSELSQ